MLRGIKGNYQGKKPFKWIYCLLRFKWRKEAALEGSLSIFNHLRITMSVPTHVQYVCGCAGAAF